MNLLPSNVGAEPKKVAVLIGLIVLGGVAYYVNRGDDAPGPTGSSTPVAANPAPIRPLDRKSTRLNSSH